MLKFTIDRAFNDDIDHLIAQINRTTREPFITVKITDIQISFIGGNTDSPTVIILPREPDDGLKLGAWSMVDTAFIQNWGKQKKLRANDQAIELVVDYSESEHLPKLSFLHSDDSYWYLQTDDPISEHLVFFKKTLSLKTTKISTTNMKGITGLFDIYQPFETFEINKDKNTLSIERDNTLHTYELPKDLSPEHSLLLNKEAVEQLEYLCKNTTSDHISIYTDDDQAIFTDGQRIVHSSLASLKNYSEKKEANYVVEFKLILNLYDLKSEIDEYYKVAPLKQHNTALLYVDKDHVMIAAVTDSVGGARFISHVDIQIDAPVVYRINLNELKKINIKDLNNAKQTKVQLLRSKTGERKLSFYSNDDGNAPYSSIYNIELAPNLMPQALVFKDHIQGGSAPLQIDMLGFENT